MATQHLKSPSLPAGETQSLDDVTNVVLEYDISFLNFSTPSHHPSPCSSNTAHKFSNLTQCQSSQQKKSIQITNLLS